MNTSELTKHVSAMIHYSFCNLAECVERLAKSKIWRWPLTLLMFFCFLAQSQCTYVGHSHDSTQSATMVSLPQIQMASVTRAKTDRIQTEDPFAFLTKGLKWLNDNAVQDYQGTFVVQERIQGRLNQPAVCQFKFREEPFALAIHVMEGAGRVDRMLYVEGQQLVVHPTGFAGKLVSAVCISPDDSRVRENSLRPLSDFGIRNALERIIDTYQESEIYASREAECLGFDQLNGVRVVRISLGDSKTRALVDLDTERFMPLRIRQYDQEGQLICSYQYQNLQFNCGLDESDFSKQANGL